MTMTGQDNRLWLQMWQNSQTDEFHQTTVNKYLVRFWPRLDLAKGNRVFVPLCGKSLDMIWLAGQGCEVIGVELSPIAVKAFFEGNNLQATKRRMGEFTRWQHGNITILCGDYFSLKKADLGHIDTVYDRAALTALPEAVRKLYVAHLHRIIAKTTDVFLLTIEDGTEHAVPQQSDQIDEELISLYANEFEIRLENVDCVLEANPELSRQPQERVDYKVYRLSGK